MNKKQKRIVKRLIAEWDRNYFSVDEAIETSSEQERRWEEGILQVDLARRLFGFRTESALRKAVGAPKSSD